MASAVPVAAGGTVWTTCDKANVTVVHDVTTHTRLATIPRPPTVERLGGVPHDAIANDRFGYVSYIRNRDGAGYVGVYALADFTLVRLIQTAADPHLGLFADSEVVIAAQGGTVSTYPQGLTGAAPASVDATQASPHGVTVALDGLAAYVTNIAEGGEAGIVTYRLGARGNVGAPQAGCPAIRTARKTPHNLSLSSDNQILLVTHSGPASGVVGLWTIGADRCVVPRSERLVRTGTNPFGVCFLRALTVPPRG